MAEARSALFQAGMNRVQALTAEAIDTLAELMGRQMPNVRLGAARNLERMVREKRERLDRVDEAFLHERSIDPQTYERQRDQLREQIGLAEIELADVVSERSIPVTSLTTSAVASHPLSVQHRQPLFGSI